MKTVSLFFRQKGEQDVQVSENSIVIPTINADIITNKDSLSSNIKDLFGKKGLLPSENAIDLLNLGLAVYSLDQLVSRNKYGHYQWTRDFTVHLPVFDSKRWKEINPLIEETLAFLSGDKWTIDLIDREKIYENVPDRPVPKFPKVCLFSGGLDSFIGAVNLLENENVILVGHHKKGGYEKSPQEELINSLKNHYSDKEIENLLFYVQPEKSQEKDFLGENTQRARSFLFLVLGAVVANSYDSNIPLYVPENGLISLNLPLTQSRQGTFSTKTTHPFFIDKFKKILIGLGINNDVINPFQFKTKGEMIESSCNKNLVVELMQKSVSCSKAGHHIRWNKKEKVHCGYCIPCIIRRAALHKVKVDDPSEYVFDVRSFDYSYNKDKGADLHAFRIAIHKYLIQGKLNIFEVLKSGKLPEDDIDMYLDLVKRGLKEVDNFIKDI